MLLVGILFANMLPRSAFSPLLPSIEAGFGISHAEATRIFLLSSTGATISMFLTGFISSLLTYRRMIMLSVGIMGLNLILIYFSPSFTFMQIFLFLLGFGGGLYFPAAVATITSIVVSKDLGKALAIHELGPNLSMVSAPLLVGLLQVHIGWRQIILLLGFVMILIGLVFLRWGKGGDSLGSPPSFRSVGSFLVLPDFWIILILLSLILSATVGVYSILPTFLIFERGYTQETANILLSLSRIGVLLTVSGAGWIVDRIGVRRSMFLFLLGAGITTLLLGIARGSFLFAVAFAQPLLGTCFFPAALAAVVTIGEAGSRNLVYATLFPVVVLLGTGLAPSLFGVLGDHGLFGMGIAGLGTLMILIVPLVGRLKA
jgi:NNP family nitrate/nitrite transporter-like MFS transporter